MGNLFNDDFLDFLSLLNKHDVAYMVVGGFAVNVHGYQRTTGDVDVWVERTAENYKRLSHAFFDFSLPVFDMTLKNFLSDEFDVFSFGRPPQAIDIITVLKGVSFSEAFAACEYYQQGEIMIRVISRRYLLQAKKASGRFKDLDDIDALQSG